MHRQQARRSRLDPRRGLTNIAPMSFFIGLFSWLVIAVLLVAGVVLATKGAFWLLGLGLVLFMAAFIKFGCLSH
jgi:hypothetical protein